MFIHVVFDSDHMDPYMQREKIFKRKKKHIYYNKTSYRGNRPTNKQTDRQYNCIVLSTGDYNTLRRSYSVQCKDEGLRWTE